MYALLADLTVIAHFAFVLFVVFGGFLLLRLPRLIWLHLPAAVWGAAIEFAGWYCPLTGLENLFRERAGLGEYEGGFVERYIVSLLYPEQLTRESQFLLGIGVILINAIAYTLLWRKQRASKREFTP